MRGQEISRNLPKASELTAPLASRPLTLLVLAMATVVRIRRKNGQVVQGCDVYIGRAQNMGGWNLPQSKWANPFPVKQFGREECIRRYEEWIKTQPELMEALPELEGKVLGCWCKPDACHGDVLVKLISEYKKAK